MNIYFDTIYSQTAIQITNTIIDHFQPQGYVAIVAQKETEKELSGSLLESYSLDEIADFNYSGKYPPLDKKTIEKARNFEPDAVHILSRGARYSLKSYEYVVNEYYKHLRYWNFALDNYEIDLAVFYHMPHEGTDFIVYQLCKQKKIKTILTYLMPFWNDTYTYLFSDITKHRKDVLLYYDVFSKKYMQTKVEDIIVPTFVQCFFDVMSSPNTKKTPTYMLISNLQKGSIYKQVMSKTRITFHLYYILKQGRYALTNNQVIQHNKQYDVIKRTMYSKKKNKKMWLDYEKKSVDFDSSRKFIYFPLHLQPENTTLPLGGVFENQLLAIQMISSYLPEDVCIYVKENPKQQFWGRMEDMYEELLKIDKVYIVKKETDTFKLIESCLATASITGTVGLEGMFYGKPFLMFGNHINMYAPGTISIRTNEECEKAIETICATKTKVECKDLKIYFKALCEVSFHGTILPENYPVSLNSEKNTNNCCEAYIKYIDALFEGRAL